MRYILASASPRRRELIKLVGIDAEVIPSNCDESTDSVVPAEVVMNISLKKARDVFNKVGDKDATVIGADTIVCINNRILGKPADEAEAFDMLKELSGNKHDVFTGVSIVTASKNISFFEQTGVIFMPISDGEIKAYIATGEPLDKAGAYGIQGYFARHIRGVIGDYYNVVGLPVAKLYQQLKDY